MGTDSTAAYLAEHDQEFRKACEVAGVKPTRRQYSKYRNRYGAAARAAGHYDRKNPEKQVFHV